MNRRLLFWLVFVVMAALTLYGLLVNALLIQRIWTADGLERLHVFLAGYGVWTLAGAMLFPGWMPHVTAGVALVYATAAAGPAAVLTLLLFLASSWALGRTLAQGVPAMMAGASIYAFLIGIAVHFPVNYWPVYLAALAVPVIWRWRAVAAFRLPGPCTRADSVAASVLLAILIIHLVAALKPEGGVDALAVHLAVPASVAGHHRWTFDFRHTTWSLMPLTADWTYTAVYLPGGAAAAKLLNYSFLIATTAMLYGLLRRNLASTASLVFCALYASSPILHLVTGSLFVENFWTAVLLAGFVCIEAANPVACAVLLGTGIASKYGAVFYAVPVLVLLVASMKRRGELRRLPAAMAVLLCFAAPPYVRAYLESGNPVYPFLNTVFRSPDFDSKEAFSDHRFRTPLDWRTLYDLTFHTSRYYEGQNGGWGFHYLLFLPVAMLSFRRNAALAVSLPYSILSFLGQSNARYLCPALPLLTLAGAARPHPAMLGAAIVFIPLNTYFLAASGWQHKSFDRFGHDPTQILVTYLNREHRGEPAAFIETNHIAGLLGKAHTMSWHNHTFWRGVLSVDSPRACLNLMKSFGLRLFVSPADLAQVNQPALRHFLLAYTRPEAEYAGWRITRLDENWAQKPAAVLLPGSVDDMDPRIEFDGVWDGDRQFPSTANGSVTYSSVPGAFFRFRFRGTAITYVYTRAANRGIAEVLIDGAPRAAIDLYSGDTEWQARTPFGGLAAGEHSFEVRVSGRRNPKSSDVYVDLDQIAVESK